MWTSHLRNCYCQKSLLSKYKNAYKPWTIEEDMKFETLRIAGASVAELASIFDRNKGAIRSRLRKFGLQKLKS